jgi:Ca-activated chloride channel family protein
MAWKYPILLWLLAPLATTPLFYLRAHRRRVERGAIAFPLDRDFRAVTATAARPHRRHLPAILLLAALVATVVGSAGPVVPLPNPSGYPVAIIIDVSRSMEENDILPSRIEATKTAALAFVDGLPRASRITLITFGSHVSTVVPLTDDRERIRDAIRHLTTQLRTQLGTGLIEALNALTGESPAGAAQPAPSGPGATPRAVAVLMSDGRASDGIPPLEAAAEAKRRGVRVFTVGVGTTTDPSQLRSGYWGVLDEPTLRAIAAETGGTYYHASAASRLREVYARLARAIGWERKPTEVAAIVAGLTVILLAASVIAGARIYALSS